MACQHRQTQIFTDQFLEIKFREVSALSHITKTKDRASNQQHKSSQRMHLNLSPLSTDRKKGNNKEREEWKT
jgi:hypothetical protein